MGTLLEGVLRNQHFIFPSQRSCSYCIIDTYTFGPHLQTCIPTSVEVVMKYDQPSNNCNWCLGNLKAIIHYSRTSIYVQNIPESPPHPKFCDFWKNLATCFPNRFWLDFCETPESNSCVFHKLHACKQHTFVKRMCGPFLLYAYVSVVVDWRPLWAIQWHFRTISLCRKPTVVFL